MAQDETDAAARLAEALRAHALILYGVDQRARCSCGWIGTDAAGEPERHRLDALLPVVRELGDLRAAEALRAAAVAARGMHDPPAPDCVEWADWLDARAATLRGEAGR